MAHSVVDASPAFKGKSKGGLYGDVIEELDYHAGRLLDAIDELGLRDNTLVIFTTDNGPWNNMQEQLRKKHNGAVAWGSSGPLREGKGSTWEGGVRVPCIIRWPGHVPAARVSDAISSTVDFMPTFAAMAGYEVPKDRIIDGVDQTALLLGESEQGADLCDQFIFQLLYRSEEGGAAHVDQQHDGQFPFFFKDLDMRLAGTGRDVPVNITNVVSILIIAHLAEGHPPAFEGTVILS